MILTEFSPSTYAFVGLVVRDGKVEVENEGPVCYVLRL